MRELPASQLCLAEQLTKDEVDRELVVALVLFVLPRLKVFCERVNFVLGKRRETHGRIISPLVPRLDFVTRCGHSSGLVPPARVL